MHASLLASLALAPAPVLLVDGGSRRAGATVSLRLAAAALRARLGCDVRPVSLRFSDEVAPAELGGEPARTLAAELGALAAAGVPRATVAPLFLGPSGSLGAGVDACAAELAASGQTMDLHVADCLVASGQPDDRRVARALAALVLRRAREQHLTPPLKVVLVDHGTPSRRVHDEVRCRLERELRELLGERAVVAAASMERRPGAKFAFNEPLLAARLGEPPFDEGDVVVAMAFLAPGRHAGAGGDVDDILAAARAERPGLRTHTTPLLAAQPLVLEALADRARAAAAAAPTHSSGARGAGE